MLSFLVCTAGVGCSSGSESESEQRFSECYEMLGGNPDDVEFVLGPNDEILGAEGSTSADEASVDWLVECVEAANNPE